MNDVPSVSISVTGIVQAMMMVAIHQVLSTLMVLMVILI